MGFRENQFRQRAGVALCAAAVFYCIGCWEEVRYDPSSADQPAPAETASSTPKPTSLSEGETPASEKPSEQQTSETIQNLPAKRSDATAEPNDTTASPSDLPAMHSGPPEKPEAEMVMPVESGGYVSLSEPFETEPAMPPESIPSDEQSALHAWQLGSQWSLAAAYFAKNATAEQYEPMFEQAAAAAERLQAEVPPLPEAPAAENRVGAVVAYLLSDCGPQLAKQLAEQHGAECAAIFDLATTTHGLLLVYSPRKEIIQSQQLQTLLSQVRRSARDSGLPEPLWSPLIALLESHAPFAEVKQSIFSLHERIGAHLASRD